MSADSLITYFRLDGLNKNMRDWDSAYYGRMFNQSCNNSEMININYPDGKPRDLRIIFFMGRVFGLLTLL